MFEVRCLCSKNFLNLCRPYLGQFLVKNGGVKYNLENISFESFIFFRHSRFEFKMFNRRNLIHFCQLDRK